ncbi:MAG TPA: UbiA-like polyprenyltransferase [Polyangia bacterium]|nr:UbiA-like polyprenyltransferase [Polyangia bacterium]
MTVAGASEQPREGALAHVAKFGRMVKFEHTLFALPFALASAAIAARGHGISGARIAGIVLAMAGARTAAMGFNRIVDRQIDARNPRTARREIPAGVISLRAAWTMTLAATALFVAAAAALGPLCLALSPIALLLLFGYSFTKRFTALCHLFLGLAIAAGPAGAWIAVRGDFGWPPGLLMIAVASWIAGFDVLYALSDRDFDRAAGIHSIPARLGVTGALIVSALLHVATVAALIALGTCAHLGPAYLSGVAIVVALLIYEHAIVRPTDLSRLDVAFFNLNGWVSVIFFVATVLDVLVR